MGRGRIDLTGRRIGRLTVLRPARQDARGSAAWRCRCDCGREVVFAHELLVSRRRKSCGCLSRGRPKIDQRNQAVLEARQQGETLKTIGEWFGLSRQRVQQIVQAND